MEEEREYQASNSHGSILVDPSEPQTSFMQQIPEPIKLIAASCLVAIIIHHFFFKGSSFRVLLGRNNDGGDFVGSDPLMEDDEEVDDEDAICSSEESSHQSLTQTTECVDAKNRKRKKQIKPAKKASANRNYDKLICNKTLPSDEDVEPTEAQDVANSSLDQDTSSLNPSTEPETQTQQQQQEQEQPPPIQLHSQATHPGLSAYYNWHATITSLYRIYAISTTDIFTNTFHPAVLPMHPSSERGNVAINITVSNHTR